MKRTINVKPNQSFLDVIIQGSGTLEAGMKVAADNGWPLSYFPTITASVLVSDAALDIGDSSVLKYLKENSIIIGTKALPAWDVLITEDGGDVLITEDGDDTLIGED